MQKHFGWLLSAVILLACAGSAPPPQVVNQYLEARVRGDANAMIALSCPAWESQARLEADSIRTRAPKLEGVSCKEAGSEGNTTLVACSGKIITNYGGESREVNLAERQFKLESGRMCGYK